MTGLIRIVEAAMARVRRGAILLVILATVVLTGCTAVGRIEVRSADEVVVDLTVSHDLDDYPCRTGGFGPDFPLRVSDRTDAAGKQLCRIEGTTHPERLRQYLGISHVGEFVTVSFNPLALSPGTEVPGGTSFSAFSELDVTVQFPGRVLATTGEADGDLVRFRDPKQLLRPYGLQADALDHPGPSWSLIGPVAGFAGGISAAALAVLLWVRRRRPIDVEDAAAPASGREDDGPHDMGEGRTGADRAEQGHAAQDRAGETPVAATPPDPAPDPRPDDTIWAPPEGR